jgi:hypothetical protein
MVWIENQTSHNTFRSEPNPEHNLLFNSMKAERGKEVEKNV